MISKRLMQIGPFLDLSLVHPKWVRLIYDKSPAIFGKRRVLSQTLIGVLFETYGGARANLSHRLTPCTGTAEYSNTSKGSPKVIDFTTNQSVA